MKDQPAIRAYSRKSGWCPEGWGRKGRVPRPGRGLEEQACQEKGQVVQGDGTGSQGQIGSCPAAVQRAGMFSCVVFQAALTMASGKVQPRDWKTG